MHVDDKVLDAALLLLQKHGVACFYDSDDGAARTYIFNHHVELTVEAWNGLTKLYSGTYNQCPIEPVRSLGEALKARLGQIHTTSLITPQLSVGGH